MRTRRLETYALESAQNLVVLKVLVPKGIGKQEEGETGPKDFREAMSVAEQFLTAFSSLYEASLEHFLYGQETISLELVAKDQRITFFLIAPQRLQSLIERQLTSYYPDAEIEPSQDFRLFEAPLHCAGAYFATKKNYSYPIRTYKELESDPLNALTNSFSKLPIDVRAGLQVLIRPTSGRWRERVTAAAQAVAEGKGTTHNHWFSGLILSILSALRSQNENKTEEATRRLTPIQEEMMKRIQEKGSRVGFHTQIRLIVASPNSQEESQLVLKDIASAFSQYTAPELNFLRRIKVSNVKLFLADYILRRFRSFPKSLLSTEELASIYHLPNQYIETPNIEWLMARVLPPPANFPKEDAETVILGKSVYRGQEKHIRIKTDDRRRHLYAIGKTGVGKTTFFTHEIEQDILAGRGVCYIDPNGDAVNEILELIPKERAEDVILFDPSDTERPMGLNMLEWKRAEDRDFLVSEWLEIFYKLFDPNRTGMVGPQFEHWGRNASLTVMARPGGGTLIDIPLLITDDAFREDTLQYVTDPVVRAFWEQQMAKTADFHKSEMYNYFISKFGRFMTNDLVRNIIGQSKSSFDFREVMDQGKILLVNLSKGKIGEANSFLLGMILVSKIQVAAFQRADIPEEERRDFYLYVDEFQNFTTDTFKTILSEARKYRLNLNITNQYIAQLPEEIRDAVIGNAGTLLSFRIGAADAEFMAKEFPNITEHDLVNLTFANAYIKLLIDGTPTKPFSLRTIKTASPRHAELGAAIKQLSRLKYGKDHEQVEREITNRRRVIPANKRHIPDFPPAREG